jgi:ribonuclease BN (tRNA processing enzyme)
MRLTVLGGCGAWPAAGQACSGYLLEAGTCTLLLDPGYGTLPRLLELVPAHRVDAVVVTHSHPDHCADLNPLLRARVLGDVGASPLPVLAPAEALDAVLALDNVRGVREAAEHVSLADGDEVSVGPMVVAAAAVPHHVPTVAVRVSDGDSTLAFTGDSGPDRAVVELARGADVLLAEATFPEEVPADERGLLCDAVHAARQGTAAGAGLTLLTHWWPTSTPDAYATALRRLPATRARLARPGEVLDVG